MKVSTVALILGGLAVLWVLMKKTTGGVTVAGSASLGNGGVSPGQLQPQYGPMNPYYGQAGGTSVAQDVQAYAGAASSLINAIGGNIGNFVDAAGGGD